MPKAPNVFVVATIVLIAIAMTHIYVWLRLGPSLLGPPWWSRTLGWLMLAAGLSIPMSMVLWRAYKIPSARFVLHQAHTWLGWLMLAALALFTMDLLRWGVFGMLRGLNADVSEARRLFFLRTGVGVAGVSTIVSGLYAMRLGSQDPKLEEVSVPMPGLSPTLDGFRIVQLSDIHVGPSIQSDDVEAMCRIAMGAHPDLVVVTGDVVDGTPEQILEHVEKLGVLSAPHGVFLCTGNHEYYSDAFAWIPHFNRLGLRVLENEHVNIGGDDGFTLAGVYDHYSAPFGHGPDVTRALHGRDPNKPVVLLCHQPRDIEKAARSGVNLQLSGHTHGGQIWPVGYLVKLVYGYVAGLYRISDRMHLYINRGTGFWGPGMRLPKPGEITLIRLKAV